jgi:hypothetical protein
MLTEINLLYFLVICQSLLILRQCYLLGRNRYVGRPENFVYKFLRKDDNMALVYALAVGATADSDVVERRLTIDVNGEVAKINSYPATTVDLGELSFKQGDSVILSLVDVDDAGNASEPAVLAFVAKDTIPPQAPGGFSVALIREEADEPETTVAPNEEPEVSPPSG